MFSFIKSLHFHLSQVGRQESADNKEPITDRKYANGVPSGTNATCNCEKMKFDYVCYLPNKGLTTNALSCSQNNDHRSTSNMTRYRF